MVGRDGYIDILYASHVKLSGSGFDELSTVNDGLHYSLYNHNNFELQNTNIRETKQYMCWL